MVRRVGVTGGIGAGKSSVLAELRSFGYAAVDADSLARDAVLEPEVKAAIQAHIGFAAFTPDGVYNRAAVRELVFADSAARARLEAIVHPAVAQRFERLAGELQGIAPDAWIFYEASLLVEVGRAADFDALVLVTADSETRIRRLAARNGFTREQALAVINAQWPDDRKRPQCTHFVSNDASPAALADAVRALVSSLKATFSARSA